MTPLPTQKEQLQYGQYAESDATLLPGYLSAYKWDDIQLLQGQRRLSCYCIYEGSIASNNVRHIVYTTFCNVWRNFLGYMVLCKPMTGFCATCQKSSATIICSHDMTEEEKSKVRTIAYKKPRNSQKSTVGNV